MSHKQEKTSFVQIEDCCCGVRHRMKQEAWEQYRHANKDKRSTVPVGNGLGAWWVPRIFIACHSITAAALRELAALYQWEQVQA